MPENVTAHSAALGGLVEEMISSTGVYEDYIRQSPEDDLLGFRLAGSVGDDLFLETGMYQYSTVPERTHSVFGFRAPAGERDVGVTDWVRARVLLEAILAQSEFSVLQVMVQELVEKVGYMEHLLEDMSRMMLAMSQSYYWTPEWQAKEERADADARLGRSKQYSSAEDAIADLNR